MLDPNWTARFHGEKIKLFCFFRYQVYRQPIPGESLILDEDGQSKSGSFRSAFTQSAGNNSKYGSQKKDKKKQNKTKQNDLDK